MGCGNRAYALSVLGLAAAWLCLLFAVSGHIWAAILPQIYILPHFLTWQRMVKINKGKELNIILGETSRNMLLFGILLTLGLIYEMEKNTLVCIASHVRQYRLIRTCKITLLSIQWHTPKYPLHVP